MALSDDQRAMLRLLAQREQGYEDMAALMGVSVEELRGRVREALAELEQEGKEAPSLPPEPQQPQARAEPQREQAQAHRAESQREQPQAPQAEPPQPAAPPPAAVGEPPELSATPPTGQVPPQQPKRGSGLPSSTGARIGAAAVAAAVVVVVVLLLVLGGGDGDSDSTTGTTTTVNSSEAPSGSVVEKAIASTETGKGKGKEVTKAILAPDGGGDAQGVAVFGRVKNTLALQIIAEGLEPLGKGESYAIWIAQSPTRMLPLAASPVRKNGTIASQFEVPTELLAFLANETFDEIAITRASLSKLNTALKSATKAKETPAYTGTPVMRGEITGPIVGAAQRIEEEQAGGK